MSDAELGDDEVMVLGTNATMFGYQRPLGEFVESEDLFALHVLHGQ